MSYKILLPKVQSFKTLLEKYVLENDCVDDSYHIAKKYLDAILERSNNNSAVCDLFINWLDRGGSIDLKFLLSYVGNCDDSLSELNAFCLLDSVSCSR